MNTSISPEEEVQMRTQYDDQLASTRFGHSGVSSAFILSSSTPSPQTATTCSPSSCDPLKPLSTGQDHSRSSSSALPLSEEEGPRGPSQDLSQRNSDSPQSECNETEESTSYFPYKSSNDDLFLPAKGEDQTTGTETYLHHNQHSMWSRNGTCVNVEAAETSTIDPSKINDVGTATLSETAASYLREIPNISRSNSQSLSHRVPSMYRSLGSPREVEKSLSIEPSSQTGSVILHPALQSRYYQATNSSSLQSQTDKSQLEHHKSISVSVVTEYREARLSLLEARYKYARQQGHTSGFSPYRRDDLSISEYTRRDREYIHYPNLAPRSFSTVGTSHNSVVPLLNTDDELVKRRRPVSIPQSERPAQAAARALVSQQRNSRASTEEERGVEDDDRNRKTPQRKSSRTRRPVTPTGRQGSATPRRMTSISLLSPGKPRNSTSRSSGFSSYTEGSNPHYMMDKGGRFHVLDPSEIPTGCPLSPFYIAEGSMGKASSRQHGPPRCAGDIPLRYLEEAEENRHRRERHSAKTNRSHQQHLANIGRLDHSTSKTHEKSTDDSFMLTDERNRSSGVSESSMISGGKKKRATSTLGKRTRHVNRSQTKRASSAPAFRWPFGGSPPRPPSDLEKERNRRLRSRSSTKKVRPEFAAPAKQTYRLRLLFDLSPPSFDDDDISDAS